MSQPYADGLPHANIAGPYDSNEGYNGYIDGNGHDVPGVDYLDRPLSEFTGIPYRGSGVTGHGVDTDAPLAEYVSAGTKVLDWDGDGPADETPGALEIVHKPVDVRVLAGTPAGEQRVSYVRQIFGPTEVFYSAVGTPDTLRMGDNAAYAADDARDQVTFMAVENPNYVISTLSGSLAYQYAFAISTDSAFGQYTLIYNAGRSITIRGTNAIYVALYPLAAYDASKQNFTILNSVAEYTRPL